MGLGKILGTILKHQPKVKSDVNHGFTGNFQNY
jgi:hypothetical protein